MKHFEKIRQKCLYVLFSYVKNVQYTNLKDNTIFNHFLIILVLPKGLSSSCTLFNFYTFWWKNTNLHTNSKRKYLLFCSVFSTKYFTFIIPHDIMIMEERANPTVPSIHLFCVPQNYLILYKSLILIFLVFITKYLIKE